MRNKYEIEGNDVIISCKSRRDNCIYEIIIDLSDLDKVKQIDHSIVYNKTHFGKYYAVITLYLGKKDGKLRYKAMLLHKFLFDMTEEIVDHIDGDTKNNRRSNLRAGNRSNNSKNRISKNSNNKSGYRNVCLIDNWYVVQLQIEKKNTILGRFRDVDEAGRFAEEMRNKYYGDYAGSS